MKREHDAADDGNRKRIRKDCPYLHTIDHKVLDFDTTKPTPSDSIYACLVCGKYFHRRGINSESHKHQLQADHHVFIHLDSGKVFCLPDGYEVNDSSLDDIRNVLNPRFTSAQVSQLDTNKIWSRALDGSEYLPGTVGLNNKTQTDFVNVVVQSLMRVTPLRDFFLIPDNYKHSASALVKSFGELTRRIWHAKNFKAQVSPHSFVQEIANASNKRFGSGAQSDPAEFLSWLLEALHAGLGGTKHSESSIISRCFQGELEEMNDRVVPFLVLGLDLPPAPLFKDVNNIIPRVFISDVLRKFDGETIEGMRYRLTRLPRYLILHMKRFKRNDYCVEKNQTLVSFPTKNLELKEYISPADDGNGACSRYDLVANTVHDGKPGEGSYRVFVERKSETTWYELQDLYVRETRPQLVALSEAYVQIYEQKTGFQSTQI